jgi:RNA polymerase sigma-70 factor (ECF subfamily)
MSFVESPARATPNPRRFWRAIPFQGTRAAEIECTPVSHAAKPAVVERDVPSFDALFDEHSPFVWRVVRYLGVTETDAPDVCQEVFLVVHRRLAEFEGRSSVRSWIYGICLRTVQAWRRRVRRGRETPMSDPPEVESPDRPDQSTDAERARRTLLAALDRLEPGHREIFVLHEIEELPMREIAELVGCPVQTAYSRLHVARDRVAAFVRRPRRAP